MDHGQAIARDGKRLVIGSLADATEVAKQIIALAKTEFAFQASVGVLPTKTKRVDSFQEIQSGRTSSWLSAFEGMC